jgi:hypothetical protein
MTAVAAYGIVVAVLVAGMWGVSLATGGVPELRTKPWEIRHHLAAEGLLASTLLAGGILTLLGVAAGPPVLLAGLGMTLYSIVNSAGYYVQRRHVPIVTMFVVLFALTVVATAVVVGGVR